MRHRLQMVSLGEGVPGANPCQSITLETEKVGVSTQGHRIAGHNDDLPRANRAQGLDDGLSGPDPRWVENHSVWRRALFAHPVDPPAHVQLLHGDDVASVRRLEDPSSLIRCDW